MTQQTELTKRPKAYSYVRFSTPEQIKGDSFRRQTDAAEKYATTHGLDLDTKFTFHDLGMSAWQGRNKTDGMLGEFLQFVRSGDISQGSYLLVENLDRVSRENALDALDTLKDIAKAGVTVVTLNDAREYTHESLRRNPIDLMVAVMMFMRANEESETKSRRLREAWADKRRHARGQPLTALCPGWLIMRADRSGYNLIPERAAIVRQVFDMTLEGIGQHAIAEYLNKEGVPVFGRGQFWYRTYIKKMLGDPSTVGTYTPHRVERIDGKKVRIPEAPVDGYFPEAVDRATFDRVAALQGRTSVAPRGTPQNVLAGLAKCTQCGSTMTRVVKGKRSRPSLVCVRAKSGSGCDYRAARCDAIDAALVDHSDEFLIGLPSPNENLQAEWDRVSRQEETTGDEVDRITAAIRQHGHSTALLDTLRTLEADREALRTRLGELGSAITDSLTRRVEDTVAGVTDDLIEGFDVARVNATLRQLFSKVDVDCSDGRLWFHWKHAPGETTGIRYAMAPATREEVAQAKAAVAARQEAGNI